MITIAGLSRRKTIGLFQILTIMLITIAALLGFFFVMKAQQVSGEMLLVSVVGFCTLWCAAVGPSVTTLGKTSTQKFFRAGTVSDSTGIALIIIWAIFPETADAIKPSFWTMIKVYFVCTSLTMFAASLACIARRSSGTIFAALICWLIFFIALASPFWIQSQLNNSSSQHQQQAVDIAAIVNPAWASLDAVSDYTKTPWHYGGGKLYEQTTIGETVFPKNYSWLITMLFYLSLACIFGLIAYVKYRSHLADHKEDKEKQLAETSE